MYEGDILLGVNYQDVTNIEHSDVVSLIKNSALTIRLLVEHPLGIEGGQREGLREVGGETYLMVVGRSCVVGGVRWWVELCGGWGQVMERSVCSTINVCGLNFEWSCPPLSSAQDARMMEAAVAIPTAHEGSPQRGGNIGYTG